MRVLVSECKTVGHCVGYAAMYARAWAEAGRDVVFAVPRSIEHAPQSERLSRLSAGVSVRWIDVDPTGYRGPERGVHDWRALLEQIAAVEPDRVVVPSADAIGDALAAGAIDGARVALPGSTEIDLAVHNVEAAKWPIGMARWKGWRSSLRALRRLHRIGRVLSCDPYATIGPGARPIRLGGVRPPRFIPHPLDMQPRSDGERESARATLDWPADRRLVVALGDIAPRRAIDVLIAAADRPGWPADTTLVLAGKVTRWARVRIEAMSNTGRDRLLIRDGYLPDDLYAAAYHAADVIWAGSPNHRGMSSVQWLAARAGCAAIVLDTHACGRWLCGRIGPGAVASTDPDSVAAAVTHALSMPTATDAQRRTLDRFIDPDAFARTVTDAA